MKKLLTLSLLAIWLLILSWCNKQTISEWDNITVSYSSYLENNKVIETWKEVSYTVGMWQTFPIFDTIVIWMKKWETKNFDATVKEAYEIYKDNNKIQDISTTVFNKIWNTPKVWEKVYLGDLEGTVLEVSPITTKVDFNEPQTRKDVKFKIKILEINK